MSTERKLRLIGDEPQLESEATSPGVSLPDRGRAQPRPTGEQEVIHAIRRSPADILGERLTPQRVAEIRHRLATGVYNTPEVALEVAMRMMQHGEF